MIRYLEVMGLPDESPLRLPLLAVRGTQPGPTMVVLGGIHGDEYEGMAAVRDLYRTLDPETLCGTFLGVPVCNPPAFAAASRTSPIDGLNLARVFPGNTDGTATERIAHVLTTEVTCYADFLIDLHSSGTHLAMPLLIGYYHADDAAGVASRAAARRFGVPTVWGHQTVAPGRSLTGPHERGIPWLYTESPSGGWHHEEIARTYRRGVLNVMRHLDMLPGEPSLVPIERELLGDGDVDQSLVAPISGFLAPRVDLLTAVEAGDVLGVVEDLAGVSIAEIRAPTKGTVVLRRNTASVIAGDLVFLLT